MIVVDNISKSFGSVKAIDNLSFKVKEGEIVGLLGPNGAGKTTTMRIMAGFFTPDRGTVEINGINVLENPTEAQKIIGYLPENNPLYKDMLVCDLLDFVLETREIENKKQALDFAVENANIAEVYYRPIAELSKGFKQRVGIALCLLHKPQVLILDEPTEGLDPNQRTDIRSLIKKLSKHQTIIVSTHVMQEVEAVCNRLIIINKGKLVADGSPSEILRFTKGGKQILFEAEGNGIEQALKKLNGVEKVDIEKSKNNRQSFYLTMSEKAVIQPELSRLSRENNWIIWKLTEEEKGLEEVFQELTK